MNLRFVWTALCLTDVLLSNIVLSAFIYLQPCWRSCPQCCSLGTLSLRRRGTLTKPLCLIILVGIPNTHMHARTHTHTHKHTAVLLHLLHDLVAWSSQVNTFSSFSFSHIFFNSSPPFPAFFTRRTSSTEQRNWQFISFFCPSFVSLPLSHINMRIYSWRKK